MIIKQTTSIIKIPQQKTTYIVGHNLLDNLHEMECFKISDIKNFLLLADQTVYGLHGKKVADSLKKSGKAGITHIIPPLQKSNSLCTAF